MKHIERCAPGVRCIVTLASIAALAAGCTDRATDHGDGAPDHAVPAAIDPTGSWNVEYIYNRGCDRPPLSDLSTFMVTLSPDGYEVTLPGASATGMLSCAADRCQLSTQFVWTRLTAQFENHGDLVLDVDGSITGSGIEIVIDGGGTCTYTFGVTGTKN